MKAGITWWLGGAMMVLGSAWLNAADLTLVQEGKPNAVIVVAASESNAVLAASEIQKYVEKMSGATLPIVNEGEAVPDAPVTLWVGHTAAARKLGVAIPSGFNPAIRPDAFEEEGYVLKTKGPSLVVGGNSDGPYHGTLYAAYALLGKLGCRWYFPGEWGEVVPESKTVVVPDLDVTSRPDFAVRGLWLSCWNPAADIKAFSEWSLKVGMCDRELYPTAGDGFLGMLLPPGEYAEAHPEYYAMNLQGKRETTPKSQVYFTMLCLSNPEVLAASIENLKAVFAGQKKRPGNVTANGVGISPPDGTPFCFCEACAAAGQNFDYPSYEDRRMMSEEYGGFAAGIARAFPDKYVALSAYSLREMPPQGVALPPNVSVSVWPITSCVLHAGDHPACWRRQEMMAIIEGWRKLTPHVVACGYSPGLLSVYGPSGGFVPECDVSVFAREAPMLKKMGVKGSWDQGATAFMATWLSYYVRAQLLWDVKIDVAALKREFYGTFFGPEAGPHVQAWWDACEAELGKATAHVHEDWLVNHVYTVPFTTSIREHVEAARKATMTAAQRARFEAFERIADNLEAYAAMTEAEKNMDYAGAATAADRMAADRLALLKISSFFVIGRPEGKVKGLAPDGNAKAMRNLASLSGGTNGTRVASLPLETKFARDRFNEGVLAEWYGPAFDDSKWGTKNTFFTWDQQDPPEDAAGHDYDGYGWYRMVVEVPKDAVSKPLTLHLGGVINEGWVWINGQYAGHRGKQLWWAGRKALEMDVDATGKIKAGPNLIAVRVLNQAEIGGLYGRGFIYTPASASGKP